MTPGVSIFARAAPRRPAWPWVAAAGALATASWVAAAVLMADRGFDVSDEGFYVLSYRWWSSTPRVFTGVQYIYGPVFEVLGWSIPGLRVVRLVSILVVHSAFAWTFMRWLRLRRPDAPASRGWEAAGALVIVASAGVAYGWVPLSPGYNDVVLLSSLGLAALLLWAMRSVELDRPLPWAAAVCAGPLAVALLLAKWASAGVIALFLVAVGTVALRALRARGWACFLLAGVGSVVLSLAAVQMLVTPLRPLATQITEVNRLVAADTNAPLTLLGSYLSSTARLTGIAVGGVVIALAVAGIGLALAGTRFSALTSVLLVVAPVAGLLFLNPATVGIPGGGTAALDRYVSALVCVSLVATAGWLFASHGPRGPAGRRRVADGAVVVLLLLLPAVQALGTGNALAYVAVNQFACWAALLVAACTSPGPRQSVRLLVWSATACAVVVAASTGVDGLLRHPYRTAGFAADSTRVGGTGPLASIRVDPDVASRLAAVRAAAGTRRPGDPVMAFDEMAGLALLLDGRSVGEAWYSRLDHARTVSGIRSVCTRPRPWGSTSPVLIYDRAPSAADESALRSCGLSLTRDYTFVDVDTGLPRLRVYTTSLGRSRS